MEKHTLPREHILPWERACARDSSQGVVPLESQPVADPTSLPPRITPPLAGPALQQVDRGAAAQVFQYLADRQQRASAASEPGAAPHPKDEAQP